MPLIIQPKADLSPRKTGVDILTFRPTQWSLNIRVADGFRSNTSCCQLFHTLNSKLRSNFTFFFLFKNRYIHNKYTNHLVLYFIITPKNHHRNSHNQIQELYTIYQTIGELRIGGSKLTNIIKGTKLWKWLMPRQYIWAYLQYQQNPNIIVIHCQKPSGNRKLELFRLSIHSIDDLEMNRNSHMEDMNHVEVLLWYLAITLNRKYGEVEQHHHKRCKQVGHVGLCDIWEINRTCMQFGHWFQL